MTSALQIEQASYRELGKRCVRGGEVYFCFVPVIALLTQYGREHPVVIYTMVATMGLLAVVRSWVAQRLVAAAADEQARQCRWLHATIHCTGMAWGTFAAATYVFYDRQWPATILLVGTTALLSGGIHRFAPSRSLAMAYVAEMLVPSMLAHAWGGRDLNYEALLGPYLAYMTWFAGNHANAWRQSLEDSFLIREQRHEFDDLNRMLVGMDVGLAVVDEEDAIAEVNLFLCELLRLPRERLVGQPFHAILEEDDRRPDRDSLRQLFRDDGEPYRREVRCRRGSGDVAWLNMAVSIMPAGHTGRMAIRALTDISDRRLEQVVKFQETERRVLAAELHDVISQPLAGLYYGLQRGDQATVLEARTQSLLGELRGLMRNLRGPEGDIAVRRALTEFLEDYRVQHKLEVSAQLTADIDVLDGLRATFLYRVVVEALINVRRHAHARSVAVLVEVAGECVHGNVHDDGCGFDTTAVEGGDKHFGIRGMRERCELLGGKLWIQSQAGHGTELGFEFPIVS